VIIMTHRAGAIHSNHHRGIWTIFSMTRKNGEAAEAN